MKSSTGEHYLALDHIRALAAFMVFSFHFLHVTEEFPVTVNYAPGFFPLSLLDEGQTGVSLFMVLSGYLFTKLLNGREIHYRAFIYNRILRLLPLLMLVMLIVGFREVAGGGSPLVFSWRVLLGLVFPSLPNGGWSITAEFHFYLILPLLLFLLRRSPYLPLALIGVALLGRWLIFHERGYVRSFAYWTIIGRLDQFILGMVAYHFRGFMTRKHWLMALVAVLFCGFYWQFDRLGGYYEYPPNPAVRPWWIFVTTVEGLAYACLVAWYDQSFTASTAKWSRLLAQIGSYSYSIYLLHFFFVGPAAHLIHDHIMPISNFYLACLWSLLCFLLMVPLGYLSFRFVESPFLVLRKPYLKPRAAGAVEAGSQQQN